MNKTIFLKDPAQNQLTVERTFDAPINLVWKAWTDSKLLDQWWAPKPWKAETKFMNFTEGGHWLYSMNGPEGERHYARADYTKIDPQQRFDAKDAFCDEEGNIILEAPGMDWVVTFVKDGTATKVRVLATFESAENLEKIIEMGFQEGFASAHDNLDELLKTMS